MRLGPMSTSCVTIALGVLAVQVLRRSSRHRVRHNRHQQESAPRLSYSLALPPFLPPLPSFPCLPSLSPPLPSCDPLFPPLSSSLSCLPPSLPAYMRLLASSCCSCACAHVTLSPLLHCGREAIALCTSRAMSSTPHSHASMHVASLARTLANLAQALNCLRLLLAVAGAMVFGRSPFGERRHALLSVASLAACFGG